MTKRETDKTNLPALTEMFEFNKKLNNLTDLTDSIKRDYMQMQDRIVFDRLWSDFLRIVNKKGE